MSDPARPDALAFRELAHLVRNLGEELAGFRRRAQQAEARLRQIAAGAAAPDANAEERVAALEAENAQLRARLAAASERTRTILEQVRFLRQQHALPGDA